MDAEENAKILIRGVAEALARGTRHWDIHGRELTTPADVLKALRDDGQIQFEPTKEHSR